MTEKISRIDITGVRVTPKTAWLFCTLTTADGLTGTGEATLQAQEQAVLAAAREHSRHILGADALSCDAKLLQLPFSTLPQAAFSSAVLQAIWDLRSRSQNESLATALGGAERGSIPLYANINRRTLDRSPAGFAASAAEAIQASFQAIKIAPFDAIEPGLATATVRPALDAALQRIAAVRDQIGPSLRLMVDCHWRFDQARAAEILPALAELAVYWMECPIAETADNLPALRALRSQANALGIRLAGCETAVLLRGFEPYLRAGAYDVMMPDVKYAGGPEEMLRIAAKFDRHGVAFSPHNPTGPICHAASLQVCAAVQTLDILEHQYDETPLFDQLVGHTLPPIRQGAVALPRTAAPGIGVALDSTRLQTLDTTAVWSAQAS